MAERRRQGRRRRTWQQEPAAAQAGHTDTARLGPLKLIPTIIPRQAGPRPDPPHPCLWSGTPAQKLAKITVIGERFALKILAGEPDTQAIIKEIQKRVTEMFNRPLTRSREIAEIPKQLLNTLNLNN